MKRFTYVVPRLAGLCVVAVCAGIAFGCAPESFDDYKEFDTVITLRDVEYDFAANKTYAMPNTILDLSDFEDLEDVIDRDTDNDEAILDQVADEMEALGYERLPDTDDVDVIVAVGGVVQEGVAWGSYYSWVDPWSYYWSYPVTTVIINYPVGSILIHMVDADNIDTDRKQIDVSWAAGVRGVAGNGRSEEDVRALVTEAFAQSPYLNVGGTTNALVGGEL